MAAERVTEIIAGSKNSFEDAVKKGVARAKETLKHVKSAWVHDQKVIVTDCGTKEYRVNLKVTFVLE